ncbi:MobF family relaxase [Marinitenerispora sediminis]|nr:MobF family relaxase [Marinitenerispora sediminis]
MSYFSKVTNIPQENYRRYENYGCEPQVVSQDSANRRVADYRKGSADESVERVGSGWAAIGEEAGTSLQSDAAWEQMHQLMDGRDPRTGEQVVKPKMAVDPRAKLGARPLVDAVRMVAEAAHMSPEELLGSTHQAKRFARLENGLRRDGEAHRAPVRDLEAIAEAAGVDPAMLWDAEELASARKHADERVNVGNRGFDGVPNIPKSMSVFYGLLGEKEASRVRDLYLESVRSAVGDLERWTAYGTAGHHGDGKQATRLETAGFTASMTLHHAARPVDGKFGDPHLHAHVMIPNLVQCEDGKWRALGSGGRDLLRHNAVFGELVKANMRRRLTEEFGVGYERDPRTGEWEIAGIGSELRGVFSSRSHQIHEHVSEDASPAEQRIASASTAQSKKSVKEKGTAREAWRRRAEEAGFDVDTVLADVIGRVERDPKAQASTKLPSVEEIAARVWDPETGITAHRKAVNRTQVMAAVAEQCPGGLLDGKQLEALTNAVLTASGAVRLPAVGARHMSHTDRWTTPDIVDAETAITLSAELRMGENTAVVSGEQAAAALTAFETMRGFTLSDEQRRAAERLMTAGHGIDVVRGVAGAGKTTLMNAVFEGWSAAGYRVEGAATAAVAAANLKAESGIPSQTVASWLRRIESGQGLDGVDVLVIDEAAMVDDRSMSLLVRAAEASGTKLVGIGDPAQLRAVGVGGAFAAVHRIVGGETLSENRRQRDLVDRAALEEWLEGGRSGALATWGDAGRVHAAEHAGEAHDAIARGWWQDRQAIADPHQAAADVLVLAARNSDVDELNSRIRALARAGGHLGSTDVSFALRGGGRLELAAGDVVRVRRNDYRSRRGDGPDVLNGFRGVVAEVDEHRGVRVEWRDQEELRSAWISPEAIARGDLSHGYAMTIAAAQGLSCERAHVYGIGADAHSLYPAMSRSRERADLYLASEALEDPQTRLRMGEARSDAERVRRAINAYARTLTDLDDGLVIDELFPPDQQAPEWAVARRPAPAPTAGTLADAVGTRASGTARPGGLRDALRNRAGGPGRPTPPPGWPRSGPAGPRRGV